MAFTCDYNETIKGKPTMDNLTSRVSMLQSKLESAIEARPSAHNIGFAPDAVFVTGFACANPAPTLPSVGTRAQVKTSL